jgi:glycosyltransferase involved in cell wall biosynthesis
MCSSPPISTALAGAILKKIHSAKLVLAIDMRDAWSMHKSLGGIKAAKRAIERRILRAADFVSTVSQGLKMEFEQIHGTPTRLLYNVATHYFDMQPAEAPNWYLLNAKIKTHGLKLVYTGSTPEGFYDVSTIVSASKRIRSDEPGLADKFQFVFVGACAEVQREAARRGGVGDDIVFVSHLPHALSQAVQQHADALLFLGYYGVGVVSTKIFEYLALSKPILPLFVTRDSDVDIILRRYCGFSMNLLSESEIVEALRSWVYNGASNALPRLSDSTAVQSLLDGYRIYMRDLLEA